jgi:LPXTG-site transpeptidase (sortase) family protein
MIKKGLSLLLLGIGVFVLMQVAMPFIAFKSWELFAFENETMLIDPHPSSRIDGGALVSGVAIEEVNNFPAFVVASANPHNLPYKLFKITIPKMKLEGAKTLVWSNDFERNLAHLPGTPLPGEKGNVFVTGHSTLPQPVKNEKAIFANLPNLKKGDEIFIEAAGQTFTYVVEGLKIVDPKDVSVINPPDPRGRYLTLMTCVPPGFNTKRLVVIAKIKG